MSFQILRFGSDNQPVIQKQGLPVSGTPALTLSVSTTKAAAINIDSKVLGRQPVVSIIPVQNQIMSPPGSGTAPTAANLAMSPTGRLRLIFRMGWELGIPSQ